MAELWLVCEGDSDADLLATVLTNVLAADIIPKSSGGSKCAASAAEYLRRHDTNVTAAYVEDRDYRRRAEADASFSNGKPGFIWRRHAIESYLLEPAVIVKAFRSLKDEMGKLPSGGSAWVKALPDDETVVADGLRACAIERAPEEALRLTIHRLWEDLSDSANQIQKRCPQFPGTSNPDAATCRSALLGEANRLVTKARATTNSPHLDPSSVGLRYDGELARIQAQSYMNGMQFLEEFHGKELLTDFREWLRQQYKNTPSERLFIRELVKASPVIYQENRKVYGTDDFLDLANGVRALAGLPPVA